MTDSIGPGRLLLIAAAAPAADVERALREHVRERDLRAVHATAAGGALFVAYAAAAAADVRDWLARALGPEAVAFVVEFERWSALGDAAGRAWLLRRGH